MKKIQLTLTATVMAWALSACTSGSNLNAYGQSEQLQSPAFAPSTLYQQHGTDPSWQQVLSTTDLKPLKTHTKNGVQGSKISLNNDKIETGPYGNLPINSINKNHVITTTASICLVLTSLT